MISNENGIGVKGKTTLYFFPIDNRNSAGDITIKELMNSIEIDMNQQEYVNKDIPLTWLQTMVSSFGFFNTN